MKRNTRIKRCPFCKCKGEVFLIPDNDTEENEFHPGWRWNDSGLWVIGCDTPNCFGNMNHKTMVFLSKEQAIKIWNNRKRRY